MSTNYVDKLKLLFKKFGVNSILVSTLKQQWDICSHCLMNNKETLQQELPLFEFDDANLDAIKQEQRESLQESDFSKYIVYVDESGDHSLQSIDENYPIFVLAFCVFHKRTIAKLLYLL